MSDLRTRIMEILVGDAAREHAYINDAAAWAIADILMKANLKKKGRHQDRAEAQT